MWPTDSKAYAPHNTRRRHAPRARLKLDLSVIWRVPCAARLLTDPFVSVAEQKWLRSSLPSADQCTDRFACHDPLHTDLCHDVDNKHRQSVVDARRHAGRI